jgi:hypothetical protein
MDHGKALDCLSRVPHIYKVYSGDYNPIMTSTSVVTNTISGNREGLGGGGGTHDCSSGGGVP